MSEHPPVTPKWKRATQAEIAAFTREEMCAYVRGSQLAMFDLVAANEGEARAWNAANPEKQPLPEIETEMRAMIRSLNIRGEVPFVC